MTAPRSAAGTARGRARRRRRWRPRGAGRSRAAAGARVGAVDEVSVGLRRPRTPRAASQASAALLVLRRGAEAGDQALDRRVVAVVRASRVGDGARRSGPGRAGWRSSSSAPTVVSAPGAGLGDGRLAASEAIAGQDDQRGRESRRSLESFRERPPGGLPASACLSIASAAQTVGEAGVAAAAVVAADRRGQRRRVADQDAAVAGPGDRRVEQRPGQHPRVGAVADGDHDRHLAALRLVDRDRVGEFQRRRLRVGDDQRAAVVGVDQDRLLVGVVARGGRRSSRSSGPARASCGSGSAGRRSGSARRGPSCRRG